MNLIDTIRARMTDLNWTQRYVAARLGISQPAVSRYLRGRVEPGAELVGRWLELVGLDVTESPRIARSGAGPGKGRWSLSQRGSLTRPQHGPALGKGE